MTFVKFNFKFSNPTKSYELHKTRIRRFMAKHAVIQERQRRLYDERFPEGVLPSRCTFVELNPYIYVYVRLVLTRSNTMGSPIFDLTPLDFNFWGHTKDFV
jgi:hypothetical protein